MAAKKRGLGRGLNELLASAKAPPVSIDAGNKTEDAAAANQLAGTQLKKIPVDLMQRGKYQPRVDMHPETLQELADSIKAQGVVQPIVVRPIDDKRYEIIAGERRWRATQMAGLQEIPCVIRDVPDQAAMAMALIENIQRENLNPIEESRALQRLIQEFELTHQQTAEAVGRSRASVSNLLRLLDLEEDVRTMVEHGDLEMGHARALLSLQGVQQVEVAREVVANGLSVRETEKLVKKTKEPAAAKSGLKVVDPNVAKLEQQLSEKLAAKVSIQHSNKGKGKLVIQYNSLDELDGILDHIGKPEF